MRYIEMKDKNNNPIFEGDDLVLTVPDKEFYGSYLGKFCKFYEIDLIKIKVLENSNFLQIKYAMKFFKNGVQIITNQENAYWNYYSDCQDNGKDIEKKLEDFSSIENAKELKEIITSDSMFFSYIVGKGVEKISDLNNEIKIEENKNLRIENKYNENIFVDDNILVKIDDKLKSSLDDSLNKNKLNIKDYSHLLFCFKRIKDMFNFKTEIFLTDENGICQVFDINLNEEGKKIKDDLDNQKYKLEDAGDDFEKIKKIKEDIKELYKNKKYIKEESHKLCLGFNNEINLLNFAFKNRFEIKKIKKIKRGNKIKNN